MKAAVLYETNTPLRVEEVNLDDPREQEILVRNVACGVCHSDLAVIKGEVPAPLPVVIGHEGAGVVEKVGPGVTTVQPGDHVVMVTYNCGKCRYCGEGLPTHCVEKMPIGFTGALPGGEKRLRRNGQELHHLFALASLAEYAVVHERCAIKVRQDAPLDVICLLGCGASTGIGAVFNTARVRPGESIVIYGCGGVGLSAVMGAKLAGAGQLIAVDVVDERLKMALQLGADYVINASKENPQERVMALTGGADHAVECIGSTDIMTQAFASIHSRGKLMVIGVAPITDQLHIAPFEFLLGKTITGSRQGEMNWPIDMPRVVDLFMNGKLPLDKLITRKYALDEVNEAFESLARGEGIRSIVRF